MTLEIYKKLKINLKISILIVLFIYLLIFKSSLLI